MKNHRVLTDYEKKYIEKNYPYMKTSDIYKNLNLTYEQVHNYVSCKKIKKKTLDSSARLHAHYFEELLKKKKIMNGFPRCLNNMNEPKIDKNELYKSKYGKYFINKNYFSVIDNEWKAYWLGFLYADGCVHFSERNKYLIISLCQSDIGHLYKFTKSLQSDSPIKNKIVRLNGKEYPSCNIVIANKNICLDLIAKGCAPKKSLVLKFPTDDIVPKHLIRHFIRGYFDGDGYIYINHKKRYVSISIMGTDDMLSNISNIFHKFLNTNKATLHQNNRGCKSKEVRWGGVCDCEKIYKYLYQDCNIYLDRKLEKFNTLFCLD